MSLKPGFAFTSCLSSLLHPRFTRTSPDHDRLLTKLTVEQQKEFKRLTNRVFHHCLDECHGACVLRQTHLAEIVADCLRFFDGQRYDLDRFVVMPNHVHAIVQFRQGFSLETISQSWMRYSARQINQQLGSSGAFWQPEPFDHLIRSLDQFEYLQRYIAQNPMKAKLKTREFLYWTR